MLYIIYHLAIKNLGFGARMDVSWNAIIFVVWDGTILPYMQFTNSAHIYREPTIFQAWAKSVMSRTDWKHILSKEETDIDQILSVIISLTS